MVSDCVKEALDRAAWFFNYCWAHYESPMIVGAIKTNSPPRPAPECKPLPPRDYSLVQKRWTQAAGIEIKVRGRWIKYEGDDFPNRVHDRIYDFTDAELSKILS